MNSLTATEQPLADLAAKLSACSSNITNYLSGNSTLSIEHLLAFINEIKKPVKGLEIAIGQELEALVTGQLKERPKQFPLFKNSMVVACNALTTTGSADSMILSSVRPGIYPESENTFWVMCKAVEK